MKSSAIPNAPKNASALSPMAKGTTQSGTPPPGWRAMSPAETSTMPPRMITSTHTARSALRSPVDSRMSRSRNEPVGRAALAPLIMRRSRAPTRLVSQPPTVFPPISPSWTQ